MIRFFILLGGLLLGAVQNIFAQNLAYFFRIAAQEHPALQADYKRFEAAMEKLPQARSLPDPTLSFGYFLSPVETRVGPQQVRMSLSQLFPWFGTLRAQEAVAAKNAEYQFQRFQETKNALFFQVAKAYYPLYENARLQEIERENISLLTSYKTLTISNFENGKGAMTDVLRTEMRLREAEVNLSLLETEGSSLTQRFHTLLNRPKDTPITLDDSLAYPLPTVQLPALDSATHIGLAALRTKAAESQATAALARKQGMPKIGVGMDYVLVGQGPLMFPDNGKNVFMPMLTFTLPVFREKYKAARREAEFMEKSFSEQVTNTHNQLQNSYEAALFVHTRQAELLALYEKQLETLRQMLRLLLTAYSNEGAGFATVLQTQQEVLQYEKKKINALTQYYLSLAELHYLAITHLKNDEIKK